MLFVYWAVFNLLVPRSLASFQSGTSSSIGVLSTSSFPTESAANLPFNGTTEVKPDCGWIFAAAGSTAPGFYSVSNFGSFNVGSNNVGQSNVGYNNIGFGNYGQNNTGRLNNGFNNIGYLNDGYNNTGALNTRNNNIGDNNSGNQCIGYNNTQCSSLIGTLTTESTFSIGTELEGDFLFGSSLTGTGLIGENSQNKFGIGFQNENGAIYGNIGVLNDGDGLVGYNNTGTTMIGQNNQGQSLIGLNNTGTIQIGYNNTGGADTLIEASIGINQIGNTDIGAYNNGNFLTGFELTGNDLIGGTYVDTSAIELSQEIQFDPQIISSENIGTDWNSQPANENRSGVNTPFIQSITAVWSFYLEFPAVLSVVDLGCPGDIIQVYDEVVNAIILVTSIPGTNSGGACTGLNDADEALADSIYSRGFATLPPGSHYLTFSLVNGNSGTSLAFRLDYIKPPVVCKECDIPVPLLSKFNDDPIISDPPSFDLPDDIKLYTENCDESDAGYEGYSESDNSRNTTVSTSNNSTNNNSTSTDNSSGSSYKRVNFWCESKRFQMLRDTFLTHSEALIKCSAGGLAKPDSPAAQLEITSLLFQCKPSSSTPTNSTQPEALWIGSDWKGNDHRGDCLVARGEYVMKAKNCNSTRRFICNRIKIN